MVREFTEKPQIGEGWINGGFFVFEPKIFDYLHDDRRQSGNQCSWSDLRAKGNSPHYRHDGFWQCMDTVRDLRLLAEPLGRRHCALEDLA